MAALALSAPIGARGLRYLRGDSRSFPGERTRIADRGLREGMLLELMEADGAVRSHWERP